MGMKASQYKQDIALVIDQSYKMILTFFIH